ncbi:MAG TPA: hypothetical protein VGF81_03615 [Solirubrobacteraceae bacterium]
MTDSARADLISRRRLLTLAAGSLAAGALPLDALAATRPRNWPSRRLGPADAFRPDPSQFLPATVLFQWQRELDALGLRATGSAAHERYIDTLHDRLAVAGVGRLRFEPVPHRRWLSSSWSLHVGSGSASEQIPTASYIVYSGGTGPNGVTGPLVEVDPSTPPAPGSLRGKIALFPLPPTTVTYGELGALAYKSYDPARQLHANEIYSRPWFSISTLITILNGLVSAQASACVCVLDLPADAAHGAYYPYDGVIRPVPGVFVDRSTGARLRRAAASGAKARLVLRSETKTVQTRNLIGVIPGATDELTLLHSHTDGPNAIEDNGPNAIVAISQYLARLPRRSLPRSVMVLLTTGHFAGGLGVTSFVGRHRHDILPRAAAALTLEHLGAREWNPQPDGHTRLTGRAEPATIFTPENSRLVDAAYAAIERSRADPASVLRPYVATPGSPDGNGWPAEGTQLWTMGALPTANYITGPTYLLNWGIPTIDKLDVRQMRREAISFTEMLLALSHQPRAALRTLNLLRRG